MFRDAKWLGKACIQAALASLPWGEQINHQLQRVNARRRLRLSIHDARRTETIDAVRSLNAIHAIEGAVVVEVGTGWDALPTLCLVGAGASQVHTYDHRRHLRPDLMKAAAASVATIWPRLWPMSAAASLSAMLRMGNINYTAPGDARRTGLPAGSVDVFFSYAVLEHVSPDCARALIAEARRVLKPSGVFYAVIGLHDHFNGFDPAVSRVNFLRYPEWVWRLLSKNKIAYHNRLRRSDFLSMIREAGGNTVLAAATVSVDDISAVKSMTVAPCFRDYDVEDLAATRLEVAARFSGLLDTSTEGAAGEVENATSLVLEAH